MTTHEVTYGGRRYTVTRNADGSFNWPDGLPREHSVSRTVAGNVLEWGTGALNIDGCRVAGPAPQPFGSPAKHVGGIMNSTDEAAGPYVAHDAGRWPPNVVLGPAAAAELDRQSGVSTSRKGNVRMSANAMWGRPDHVNDGTSEHNDTGGASRFFPVFRYEAKAPASERPRAGDGTAHPTVKPVDLMRWLVRLVTPPGGLVLDPFAGSGTTAEACVVEGFRCVLAEKDPASAELIVARLRRPIQPVLFGDMEVS